MSEARKNVGLTIWQYLGALRQRALWILGVVLAVAIVVGLYSLTLPDRYQASAQVVLLPPLVTTSSNQQESRQLSSQSIEPILINAETAQRVVDHAKKQRDVLSKLPSSKDALDQQAAKVAALSAEALERVPGVTKEDAMQIATLKSVEIEALLACSPEQIQRLSPGIVLAALQASTAVETRMATETVYSPVIIVRAAMADPILARVVANQSARVLVDRYYELTMTRAEQTAADLEVQVQQQKKTLADIDKQAAQIANSDGNVGALERDIYWLDRTYGEMLLQNGASADSPDLAALRERIAKLHSQLEAAKSKIDSLEMVRMVHVAALRTLLDTQAEVQFTPPARLKKMEVLSPSGPFARRIGPDRLKLVAVGAATGLIFSLAGIFVLMLLRDASMNGKNTSSDSQEYGRNRGRRGDRMRPRYSNFQKRADYSQPSHTDSNNTDSKKIDSPKNPAPRTSQNAL